MTSAGFERVRVMVAESGQLRRQIKNVLHENGFTQVSEAGDVSAVRGAIELNLVDLLIGDVALNDADLCELLKSVRQFKFGSNPFLAAIFIAGDLDRPTTMRIIDSGPDDLLVKPVTIGAIKERVMALTSGRKKFVVTSDYIGPTRRTAPRPGAMEIPEIDVPNPVKDRIDGELTSSDLDAAIVAATQVLNGQKIERDAYQVVWLTERLMPLYEEGGTDANVVALLDRLVAVSGEIGRRLRGTPYDHVGELCASLLAVATGLRASPTSPSAKDLQLLPQLAAAVRASLSGGNKDAGVARNIAASVIGTS